MIQSINKKLRQYFKRIPRLRKCPNSPCYSGICDSGRITCGYCTGKGRLKSHTCRCTVVCRYCGGEGSWVCSDCKGRGFIFA